MKKITLIILFFLSIGLNAQTYFFDDFSSGNLNNWTLVDSDGDSNNWFVFDVGDDIQEQVATSASWTNGTILFPDNWMISGAIDLSGASGTILLEWKAYGQDQSWADENYTVYVATAPDVSTLSSSSTTFNEIIGASGGQYLQRSLDVSAFAGQTIYVGFRHHNVFDQFRINIDDVTVRTPLTVDANLQEVSLNRYSLLSTDNQISTVINNNGGTTITSLDLNWNDGTDDHIQNISVNIAPGQTATVTHPIQVNYSTVEEKNITVSIVNVNGSVDGDPNNNSLDTLFNTISQAGTTRVLIEQQTGTWCGWCPRGKVGMAYMEANYPDSVVLIAVHAGDPMEVTSYADGVNSIIGGSYPDAAINRKFNADPGTASLEPAYNQEINNVTPLEINSSATLNGSTLTINASATFFTNFSNADFNLAAVITEDNVTGTSSNYAQANFYSGGASGPMGGYENLPNPVPASQMTYNYVGRALLGGFGGQDGSVPTSLSDGDVASVTFTYNIPASVDQNNLNVVVLLIDNSDGSVVSAIGKTLSEVLSIQENNIIEGVTVYPNPVNDELTINLRQSNGDYNVALYDLLGRQVINNTYSNLSGYNDLKLDVNSLASGQYILKLTNNSNTYSTKIIKR